jgi:hypothetical protein
MRKNNNNKPGKMASIKYGKSINTTLPAFCKRLPLQYLKAFIGADAGNSNEKRNLNYPLFLRLLSRQQIIFSTSPRRNYQVYSR